MRILTCTLFLAILASEQAHAYVGPGLGLGALGAFFGILFAVVLAVIGVLWYPVKRLFIKWRGGNNTEDTRDQVDTVESGKSDP